MSDSIQTAVINGLALRVRFDRQSDRYAHIIECLEGSACRTLFSSVEGSTTDRWPPSPVLQQLHIETRPGLDRELTENAGTIDRKVALLVGMAGRSHWSMSVEPDACEVALVFDVACRISGDEASELGSHYRPELTSSHVLDQRWEFKIRETCTAAICVTGSERIQAAHDCLLCVKPGESRGITARWRYRVDLTIDL